MAADQREMHGKSMGFRDLDRQTGIVNLKLLHESKPYPHLDKQQQMFLRGLPFNQVKLHSVAHRPRDICYSKVHGIKAGINLQL